MNAEQIAEAVATAVVAAAVEPLNKTCAELEARLAKVVEEEEEEDPYLVQASEILSWRGLSWRERQTANHKAKASAEKRRKAEEREDRLAAELRLLGPEGAAAAVRAARDPEGAADPLPSSGGAGSDPVSSSGGAPDDKEQYPLPLSRTPPSCARALCSRPRLPWSRGVVRNRRGRVDFRNGVLGRPVRPAVPGIPDVSGRKHHVLQLRVELPELSVLETWNGGYGTARATGDTPKEQLYVWHTVCPYAPEGKAGR